MNFLLMFRKWDTFNLGMAQTGKKESLIVDEDLNVIYQHYKRKHDILLWCYRQEITPSGGRKSRKRPADASITDSDDEHPKTIPTKPKQNACSRKLSEVEDIVKKLKDKHGASFSVEKYNAWAHMIHMGKHGSYEDAPVLPYFKGRSKCSSSSRESPIPAEKEPVLLSPAAMVTGVSPSKHILM